MLRVGLSVRGALPGGSLLSRGVALGGEALQGPGPKCQSISNTRNKKIGAIYPVIPFLGNFIKNTLLHFPRPLTPHLLGTSSFSTHNSPTLCPSLTLRGWP